VKQANEMIERKQFLMEHIGVGFEDEKDPSKSLTAKQLAEELAKIDRHSSMISEAQKVYEEAKRQQLEDTKVGFMLRLSKQALTKNKKPVPTVKASAPSATAARSAASSHVQRRGMNADRFRKSGGSEDAATRELEELVPG
jgi:hypothetical protein